MLGSQLHSDFVFIPRLSGKRKSHHGSGAVLSVDPGIGGYTLHVGTGLDVFWYCGYWNSGYEHRDGLTRPWSRLQAIQQLSTMLENQEASSAERENALQAQLSDMLERWNRDAANGEVRPQVEPEHGAPRRPRAFIESRAFSKLAT